MEKVTAKPRPKREAGETEFQAKEPPDQGLRGQNTEPLCLELVNFAEGTTSVGKGEKRNRDFILKARGPMRGFRRWILSAVWNAQRRHPAGNTRGNWTRGLS